MQTVTANGTATNDLLRPSELADYLGTTVGQLSNMRYRGTGPKFITLGGRSVRYRWSDVHAWLEANTRVQTGD